jgi:hypothetical protein
MPFCPFCGEAYSPYSISLPDERLRVVDTKDEEGRPGLDVEIDEAAEAYQCFCGAWFVEGMPDDYDESQGTTDGVND